MTIIIIIIINKVLIKVTLNKVIAGALYIVIDDEVFVRLVRNLTCRTHSLYQ